MPVYEYQCPLGHVTNEYRTVADRSRNALCACGESAEKVILHAPRVFSDYEGYTSPASGQWIEGRRQRLEDLKRTGCRPYEEGEREDAEKRRVMHERNFDAAIDNAIDESLAVLTSTGETGKENLTRGQI